VLVKGLKPDGSFESVEIDEQEEEILLKIVSRYITNNCVLEQTEDGHEIHLHYLPDWIFEGKIQ
jgi:hypothetical protein